MTSATSNRAWPTLLFLAAASWFAIASLLPVADQVWRAVAVPSEPGLDAETAHLLNDGDIVVRVGDGGERDAAAFGRGLSAASHPLRLNIFFDPRQVGGTRLVASEALSRGLGPRCLPDAIEPLVRREAAGGDRTYLASLGVEVVRAAYEADRFGKPLLPLWFLPGTAVLCCALAGLSHRLGRMAAPVAPYAPSTALIEDRRKLEAKRARIEDDIAATRASLAERHAVAADATEPTWWRRLNVLRRFGERREAARARARTAVLTEKLENLQKTRTAVETEMSRSDRKLSDERRRFDVRVEDRVWLTTFSRRVVGVLAITVAVLAAAHATTAAIHPGALISASRSDPILFRDDTLIATALEANPDLVEAVAAHCEARVVQPEPREFTAADAADRPPGEPAIVGPPPPPGPPFGGLQHCPVGIPCARACIPAGRVCHIGQVAHVGQECGKGYISMAKTCHVDHTPPPSVTPVVARSAGTSAPSSDASTSTYPRPDDAPRHMLPPTSVDVGGSGIASTPLNTAVPTPTRQAPSPPPMVHVDGYTRSNGTQVQPYDRAAPGQGAGRGSRR